MVYVKKLCLIMLLVVGCATAPPIYVSPAHLNKITPVVRHVEKCMNINTLPVHIINDTTPNAFCDGEAVYFTTAIVDYFEPDFLVLVSAHELAHYQLGHLTTVRAVSIGVTGVMIIANIFIPGAGYLNHVINPAVTNNFSKIQEYEADFHGVKSLNQCRIQSPDEAIKLLQKYSPIFQGGGGFWSTHPDIKDRIENLKPLLRSENPVKELDTKRPEPIKSPFLRSENNEVVIPKGSLEIKEMRRDGRFIAYDNGTVLDTQTNLMWAARDNGSDISWHEAKKYCENYDGGGFADWRLPTMDELVGLYDPAKTSTNPPSVQCRGNYHITELIHITCNGIWSSDGQFYSEPAARIMNFQNGKRVDNTNKHNFFSYRALPVRNAK